MSTKHLARLRAQAQEQPAVSASEDDSDSEEEASQPQLKFNPFDLIQDEEGSEAESEAAGSPPSGAEAAPPVEAAPQQKPAASRKAAGKQAKQKGSKAGGKAAGGKGGGKAGSKAAGKAAARAGAQGGDNADIDQLLKDLDMASAKAAPVSTAAGAAAAEQKPPLLGVNTKLLKADEELRRIFGSAVIAEEAREARQEGQRRGQRHGRAALKRGLLITPRPHWPPLLGGLSMEIAGVAEDGRQLFTYAYSSGYSAAQAVFEDAQASHDPNAIAELLQQTPYHTDALLAMCQLYRATGEHSTADDMLERALYAFEMAWHHSFNIASGNCGLVVEHEANKGFFEALFWHLQGLSRRGLHRPALEVAKLLLALDPRDPMGMVYYLSYVALCAQDYRFFRRFVAEWDEGSVLMLPNWAFSTALAGFQQQRLQDKPKDEAKQQQDQQRRADEDLSRAVAVFPLAVQRLMARLNDQGVGRGLEWQSILGEPLFAGATDRGSATYNHVTDLFVERHHALWKPQEVQDWLRETCRRVAASGVHNGVSVEEWAGVVDDAFPPSEEDRTRHLRVQDFSDTTAVTVPPEEVQAQMQAAQQGQAAAQLQQHIQAQLAALQAGGNEQQAAALHAAAEAAAAANGGRGIEDMSTIEALLRSLVPWFNAGDGPPPEDGGEWQPQPGNGGG